MRNEQQNEKKVNEISTVAIDLYSNTHFATNLTNTSLAFRIILPTLAYALFGLTIYL